MLLSAVCLLQELRGKLEASRQDLERLEQQMHDVEAAHSKVLLERDEKVST